MKKSFSKVITTILIMAMAMFIGLPAFAQESNENVCRTVTVTEEMLKNNVNIALMPGEEICLEYENGEKVILGARLESVESRSLISPYQILAGKVIFYQKYYCTSSDQYEVQVDVPVNFHYTNNRIIFNSVGIEAKSLHENETNIAIDNCTASKTAQGENYVSVQGNVNLKYENIYAGNFFELDRVITGTITINEDAQIIISTDYLNRFE